MSWPEITVIKTDNVIVFQLVIRSVQLNLANKNPAIFSNSLRTFGSQIIIIHGYCISVRRFYIRTAPLWPLLCGMRYAQDIHFSPQAIDLINQNKMRVNNQFPGTFHTTVAAFYRACLRFCVNAFSQK
ncbi:hypothetical protein BHF25_23920 [Escherichia coli]|nr:hypothetical protein EC12741_B0061 [Escherichia coli 1.2741]KHI84300.1 hypothetical protein PU15_26635 [Escherichia coli]KIG80150.1 hypothetical protein PU38_15920 [Escherichia coli]KLG59456.1 hypothetical protein WR24_27225 [Escherichia coli]KLG69452.1 hypothetical protein WR12_26625 [Escherichia coli]